jgi:hypothetical protein
MGTLQGPEDLTADYRYFIAPVVTGADGRVTKIIEIPFQDVTWGRALKEAGSFTGSIPVIEDTFNLALYENTMPAKNAIYIVRNGVCVWGGIIWSRNYSANEKVLEVSASEFTSYLYHRAAWKTWSNDFQASVEIVNKVATVKLSRNDYDFTVGMPVYVDFGNETNLKYSGYYSVSQVLSARSFKFLAPNIPDLIEEELTTIQVRTNTYEYARGLLEELKIDFFGIDFPNSEIEPAQQFFQKVVSISRTNGIATVTQDESYVLVPGQKVTLSDIPITGFDNKYTVISTPTNSSFTVASPGNNLPNTNLSSNVKNIITLERSTSVALLQTSVAHGFSKESIVTVTGIGGGFDGRHIITDVPSSTTFTYNSFGDEVALSPIQSATATVIPAVKFATFGEFPANAGIGIDYSTSELSSSPPISNETIRGYELGIVGEILENYSDIKGGFEYRIDCDYDSATDSFTRTFVFLPIVPEAVEEYGELESGEVYPISVFGADKIVFEFPGNITELTLEENAEDAATRFWVRGNLEYLSQDASQPYAAASALELLNDGWPILDQIEDQKDVGDEAKLYSFAERYLDQTRPPIGNIVIAVNGSLNPKVGTYKPGDWCSIIIDDDFIRLRLESQLELQGKRDVLVRKIDAFSVSVPNSPTFPELVSLELVFESGVDKVG